MRRQHVLAHTFVSLALLALAGPVAADTPVTMLRWTASGDDGMVGRAARYDIRRSSRPITPANFGAADTVGGAPDPAPAGTLQACDVVVPSAGIPWYFAIRVADESGNWSDLSNVASYVAPVLSTDARPGPLALSPPWPNPARSRSSLYFETPERTELELGVYDVAGRLARTLWAGPMPAGRHLVTWDLRDADGNRVGPGTYFARARCAAGARVRTIVVTR